MKLILKNIMVGVLLFCSAAAFAKPELSYNLPLPGGTLGNEKLQYDTLMPVYTMAQIKVQDCQKYSVTDTKVTKQPYDLKTENGAYIDGKWEELWTVSACGKKVYVPIRFVLDRTGATWAISEKNVKISDK